MFTIMLHPSFNQGSENSFRNRGGAWIVVQISLMVMVAVTAYTYRSAQTNPTIMIIGGLCLLLGAAIGIAGALALKSALTPFPKPLPGTRLIRHGIYAHIRHPLYTSVLLGAFGWALVWQSWPSFWLALALVPFFMAKANYEERWLKRQFSEYSDYSKTTKMFVPWIY